MSCKRLVVMDVYNPCKEVMQAMVGSQGSNVIKLEVPEK